MYPIFTDIHQGAKTTVSAVEQRYDKKDSFDGAWQEVLNHATIKVIIMIVS